MSRFLWFTVYIHSWWRYAVGNFLSCCPTIFLCLPVLVHFHEYL